MFVYSLAVFINSFAVYTQLLTMYAHLWVVFMWAFSMFSAQAVHYPCAEYNQSSQSAFFVTVIRKHLYNIGILPLIW